MNEEKLQYSDKKKKSIKNQTVPLQVYTFGCYVYQCNVTSNLNPEKKNMHI